MYTGIDNHNQFYTSHYLQALMNKDLKDEVFQRWRDQAANSDQQQPYQRLRALYTDFFDLKAELEDTDDPITRHDLHADFLADLLDVFGYDYAPTTRLMIDHISF